MSRFVLLSTCSGHPAADINRALSDAGFAIREHALGSAPSVDFAEIAVAVIVASDGLALAGAQTQRWRIELGDELLPIVWLVSVASDEATLRGLDAGADVVLSRPIEPSVFIAQVRAAIRTREAGLRTAARAAEARLLGEQLQKAYSHIDRDRETSRRFHRALLPQTLPALGSARFSVSHRPRSQSGGDFYDVRILDSQRIGFFVGDVVGCGSVGSSIAAFAAQSVVMAKFDASGLHIVPPGEVLGRTNDKLLELGLDDRPLVAMLAATLDVRTSELWLARAGLPAPICLRSSGEAQALSVPGPFLGTANVSYPTVRLVLEPGDKFIVATAGMRPDAGPHASGESPLLAVATSLRSLAGQVFVDAVATELLARVLHTDDFTLLCLELVQASS